VTADSVMAGRAGVAPLARYAPRYGLEIGEPAGSEWLRVDRLLAGKLVYLRNTCCLYYTSDKGCGTVCGSCCLTPRADRLTAYEGGKPILTV
jgi:hypothetical protein